MVSLVHAGFMHHPSKVGRPHIGPSKRASNVNTTLWVIQDTYEGPSFFECVNLCSSVGTSCANGVVSPSTFDFYTGADPTKFAAAFFVNSLVLTRDPCSGLVT